MTRIRSLNRSLFSFAIVGALAFGTTQALSAASPKQDDARMCDEESCWRYCHGPGGCAGGQFGQCICY